MAESQPPEGLREIALAAGAKALVADETYGDLVPLEYGPGVAEVVTSAVLAALFEACEVREAYCTRYTDPSGGSVDYPADSAEQALAAAGRALDFVDATALRWLVIETEREPFSSTGEEKTDAERP